MRRATICNVPAAGASEPLEARGHAGFLSVIPHVPFAAAAGTPAAALRHPCLDGLCGRRRLRLCTPCFPVTFQVLGEVAGLVQEKALPELKGLFLQLGPAPVNESQQYFRLVRFCDWRVMIRQHLVKHGEVVVVSEKLAHLVRFLGQLG